MNKNILKPGCKVKIADTNKFCTGIEDPLKNIKMGEDGTAIVASAPWMYNNQRFVILEGTPNHIFHASLFDVINESEIPEECQNCGSTVKLELFRNIRDKWLCSYCCNDFTHGKSDIVRSFAAMFNVLEKRIK